MSDWPDDTIDFSAFGTLSTWGEGSQVADLVNGFGFQFSTSSGWTASQALYIPVVVRRPLTIYQLGWLNGGTVSGNADVGIYDRTLSRIISTGSTAMAGTSAIQLVDVTDTPLTPGVYYLAIVIDNGSANPQGTSGMQAAWLRACGCAQQASTFPLPSTATFATITQNRVPLILAAIEGAVF